MSSVDGSPLWNLGLPNLSSAAGKGALLTI
jgi:hypothetical protein